MGGNPYRFLLLYIDFEKKFYYSFLNFLCSSHDLLGLARLVFNQFNLFEIVTVCLCRIEWLR